MFVRHTVGLGDPLTRRRDSAGERTDGFPQALEEYVSGPARYFKVKVSNRLEWDLDRLRRMPRVLQRHHGSDYRLTLDGNEQYNRAEDSTSGRQIRGRPELRRSGKTCCSSSSRSTVRSR